MVALHQLAIKLEAEKSYPVNNDELLVNASLNNLVKIAEEVAKKRKVETNEL